MKIGVIILARANFGRWPDKILFKILGKTIYEHAIISALKLNVDHVIVSTTGNDEDEIIRGIAISNGVELLCGDPNNRTNRMYDAIIKYKLDYFVGLSSAMPFPDVKIENRLIQCARDNPGYTEYVSSVDTGSFVQNVYNSETVIKNVHDPLRHNDLYAQSPPDRKTYEMGSCDDPELMNRYLFDANIAYKLQAENYKRICEYLGHVPKEHEEIEKALMEMRVNI